MGVTLRSTKGSPLTFEEMDDNFRYLDIAKSNAATALSSVTATEPLVTNRLVVISELGVEYADKDNETHLGRVLGFITTDANTGDHVEVRSNETLTGFTGLIPGEHYFLGNDGDIILDPLTGITQQVGIAISTDTLLISLLQPTLVN